mgnify:CR=1 FL=1
MAAGTSTSQIGKVIAIGGGLGMLAFLLLRKVAAAPKTVAEYLEAIARAETIGELNSLYDSFTSLYLKGEMSEADYGRLYDAYVERYYIITTPVASLSPVLS